MYFSDDVYTGFLLLKPYHLIALCRKMTAEILDILFIIKYTNIFPMLKLHCITTDQLTKKQFEIIIHKCISDTLHFLQEFIFKVLFRLRI